jgi:glucan biosynthesis protein C
MELAVRRHEVDAVRVIGLGLLILYHIVCGFQPWAPYIYFISNEQSLENLWVFMELINVWRIPILFVVSGMGVCFAMERRGWLQIIKERSFRILFPYVFGFFFLVPIYFSIFFSYYDKPQAYWPGPGHLWFLFNIFVYVLALLPILTYLKNHPENSLIQFVSAVVNKPLGLLFLFAIPIMAEAALINPDSFSNYVFQPIHGLLLGLVCFFYGFVFVSLKETFWNSVKHVKFITLGFAFSLYLVRVVMPEVFPWKTISTLAVAFESTCWMLSVLGFSATYLFRPTKILSYLSSAVYTVYIFHFPVQALSSTYIFPLNISPYIKLLMMLTTTYAGSLLLFEFVKRIKWIRFLFGIKF